MESLFGMEQGLSTASMPRLLNETQDEVLAESKRRSGWTQHVDKLLGWLSDPSALREEDIEGPTRDALLAALSIAQWIRCQGAFDPRHVVPAGDGGIVFEWRLEQSATVIEVDPLGKAEVILFSGDRIVDRRPFPIPRLTRTRSEF